jgi:hypothetical protein
MHAINKSDFTVVDAFGYSRRTNIDKGLYAGGNEARASRKIRAG